MAIKALTVRLAEEQAQELEAVAEVDAMTVTEAIRTAIERHIAERRKDADFRNRLHDSIRRHQDILERLAQ